MVCHLRGLEASQPFHQYEVILLHNGVICANGLPILGSAVGESQTRDLVITNPTLYHCTTEPNKVEMDIEN